MKTAIFISAIISVATINASSQTSEPDYPEPEFKNEVYYLDKSNNALVRLEKESSKLETKTKLGGMGGSESGYSINGSKSSVRIPESGAISFVFSNGHSGPTTSNPHADSMMRANGMDPSMQNSMSSMFDPTNTLTLYKTDAEKGERKIYMQKVPGAMSFNHKMISSDKFTFSMKKVREGYWELVIDKHLPKGEYAFTMMGMGMGSASGETTLYAFGID